MRKFEKMTTINYLKALINLKKAEIKKQTTQLSKEVLKYEIRDITITIKDIHNSPIPK